MANGNSNAKMIKNPRNGLSVRVSPRRQQNKRILRSSSIQGKAKDQPAPNQDGSRKKLLFGKSKSKEKSNPRPLKKPKSNNTSKQDQARKSLKGKKRLSTKETKGKDEAKLTVHKQDEIPNHESNQELMIERRTRVMRCLGLIAPSGSPFIRDGLTP